MLSFTDVLKKFDIGPPPIRSAPAPKARAIKSADQPVPTAQLKAKVQKIEIREAGKIARQEKKIMDNIERYLTVNLEPSYLPLRKGTPDYDEFWGNINKMRGIQDEIKKMRKSIEKKAGKDIGIEKQALEGKIREMAETLRKNNGFIQRKYKKDVSTVFTPIKRGMIVDKEIKILTVLDEFVKKNPELIGEAQRIKDNFSSYLKDPSVAKFKLEPFSIFPVTERLETPPDPEDEVRILLRVLSQLLEEKKISPATASGVLNQLAEDSLESGIALSPEMYQLIYEMNLEQNKLLLEDTEEGPSPILYAFGLVILLVIIYIFMRIL